MPLRRRRKLKIKTVFSCLLAAALLVTVGCAPTPSQLKKTLEDNPDVLFGVIKKHPKQFLEVVNEAADQARRQMQEDRVAEEKSKLEEEFKNPKTPEIDEERVIWGPKTAAVTIVEYSDFQCPYCAKAADTVKGLMEKYGDKVRVLYKHLPFKPMAEPAARYYEAIGLQSASKAKKFHDELYSNQKKLYDGESFLEKTAKKVGANMTQLKKDLKSDKVTQRIEADMEEAKKFGFNGTPGFLVQGVTVAGAYPASHFEMIIDRHLNGGEEAEEQE
jgi:protein-disulfide isomerase